MLPLHYNLCSEVWICTSFYKNWYARQWIFFKFIYSYNSLLQVQFLCIIPTSTIIKHSMIAIQCTYTKSYMFVWRLLEMNHCQQPEWDSGSISLNGPAVMQETSWYIKRSRIKNSNANLSRGNTTSHIHYNSPPSQWSTWRSFLHILCFALLLSCGHFYPLNPTCLVTNSTLPVIPRIPELLL